MAEETRALGYLCPECGKTVYGERTAFALRAASVGLVCDFGRSELKEESDGRMFRVTVPCGVCGGEHRAEVPASQVMEGEGVGLACPATRQLCCYIGRPARVQRALADLAAAAERKKEAGAEPFVNSVIMYEVLSELRDMMARGGVSCACGSKNCAIEVHGAAVDLVCRSCGGKLRVPAATDEDLDQLCCRYTLTIKGRN